MARRARSRFQRLREALLEQLPVGDAGELVVKRQESQSPLQSDTHQGLRRLASERLLQVEEPIVELPGTAEEAARIPRRRPSSSSGMTLTAASRVARNAAASSGNSPAAASSSTTTTPDCCAG